MHSKLTMAAVAAALSLPAAAWADMTRAEFKAEKEQLDNQLDVGKEKCKTFGGNARDICLAEENGKHRVSVAELEEQLSPTANNRYKVRIARAEAEYKIAQEECDERSGATRDACLQEAKAAFTSDKVGAKQDQR